MFSPDHWQIFGGCMSLAIRAAKLRPVVSVAIGNVRDPKVVSVFRAGRWLRLLWQRPVYTPDLAKRRGRNACPVVFGVKHGDIARRNRQEYDRGRDAK